MERSEADGPFIAFAMTLFIGLTAFATSTLFVSTPFTGDWVIFVGLFSAIATAGTFVLTDPYLRKRREWGQSNVRIDLLSRGERSAVNVGFAVLVVIALSGLPS